MRKQLLAVMIVTGIAQVAGFAKLWVTAHLFGVGVQLDGYNLALVVPTLISGVLSGMVQTGLFPVRARLAAAGDEAALARFERTVLLALLVLGIALTATLLIGSRWLRPWIAPGASAAVMDALGFVWPYAAVLVAFNAVGDAVGYLLAMRDRYVYAAAAPIGNAALGAAILVAWPQGGLLSLALGTALGVALQVGFCVLALRSTGFAIFDWTPAHRSASHELIEVLQLGAWILPATVFSNLVAALPPTFISGYSEGAVAAFGYAYRLHSSAVQVLAISVAPVLLHRFSGLAARGEHSPLLRLIVMAAIWSTLIGVCALVGVHFFGAVILEIVFGGRFDSQAATRVATQWFWLTLGLGPAIFGSVLARFWQGIGSSRLLSIFGATQLVVFVLFFETTKKFGEQSVSAALSVSLLATIAVNLLFLPHGKRIVGARQAQGQR